MNPRKGLNRAGMRAYVVSGPCGTVVIERERPSKFRVRPQWLPIAFDYGSYNRLAIARSYAERLTGAIPQFLDRRLG